MNKGQTFASRALDRNAQLENILSRSQTLMGNTLEWNASVDAQSAAITKAALWRIIRTLGLHWGKRDRAKIISQYEFQWRKKKWDKYVPRSLSGKGSAWVWGNRKMVLSNEVGAALRLVYLKEAISKLKPRNVLEVGCGNGLNLILLSSCLPEAHFTGLEPTNSGVLAVSSVISAGCVPTPLQAFAPFPLSDTGAVARISIHKGSGAALPFSDASFDVVFTSLALEQMEHIREIALRELVRVSSCYVVMLEPFREVNVSDLSRKYVRAFSYFEGAIGDLSSYGLEVIETIIDMPHKAWLGTALVVARKADPN